MISSWMKSILKTAGLEDRIGFLAKNYAKKIMERLQKDYPEQANLEAIPKILQLLSQADPTRSGTENNDRGKYKYLEWLTRMFIAGDLRMSPDLSSFEDVAKAAEAAGTHYANRYSLGSIMDYQDTAELLKLSRKPQTELDQARQMQKARSKGATVEYDDGHTRVLKVEYNGPAKVFSEDLMNSDQELLSAAQAVSTLGEGTSWCTKARDTAAGYLIEGPFYVIYEDGKKVAQLHPASKQLMDINDEPISFYKGENEDNDGSTKLYYSTQTWISHVLSGLGAPGIVMNADLNKRKLNKEEAKIVGQSPEDAIDYVNGHGLKRDKQWIDWAKASIKHPEEARSFLTTIDGSDKGMIELVATNPYSLAAYLERFTSLGTQLGRNLGVPLSGKTDSMNVLREFLEEKPEIKSSLLKVLEKTPAQDNRRIISITKVLGQDNPKAREALKYGTTWGLQDYVLTFKVLDEDLIQTALSLQKDNHSWIADLAIQVNTRLPKVYEDQIIKDKNLITSRYKMFFGFEQDKHSEDYKSALSYNSIYSDPMDEAQLYHRGFFTGINNRNPQAEAWLVKNAKNPDNETQKMWERYLSSINAPWPEGLAKYMDLAKNNFENKNHFSDLFDPQVYQSRRKTQFNQRSPYSRNHPMSRLDMTRPEHRLIPSPDGISQIDPLTGEIYSPAVTSFVRTFVTRYS